MNTLDRFYMCNTSKHKRQMNDTFADIKNSILDLIVNKKFREVIIAYFPLIRHGSHRKQRVQQFFYCCVSIRCRDNSLPSRCLATKGDTHTDTQTDGRDL
jgi:hypothetical protein